MQNDHNLIEDLKYHYKHGGMHMKLIFINAAVFLLIGILTVLGKLSGNNASYLESIFALEANFNGLLYKPWGLFTSIFAHFGFLHFLFNMMFLYFSGKMLESFFGPKRLLYIYIFGGIAGGLFEIIAHEIFPTLVSQVTVVVGASGSIMAIFIALAFYRPNIQVNLFGVLPVRLIILALAYMAYDLFSLANNDGTAHFAHVGGAFFGIISINNPQSSQHFLKRIELFMDGFFNKLKSFFGPKKPKMTVKRGGKTDYEFNAEKKVKQEKTDAILDKISKSGYESLTKAEKDFLFNQSKNG